MTSTYVNDLRLNEMATGDQSGSWGTVTNLNLELIGQALGYGTEAITTNADTHTTTISDGATAPGRSIFIKYTGALDSACTITIGPNTVNKMWLIENATSGSQNIIISQGSGANVTIPAGHTKAVYGNGAGTGAAVVDAFAALSVGSLTSEGAVAGTTGTFSGAVAGTTGTFSGAVAGTTGTFSGAVAGTTGAFSGDVSADGFNSTTEFTAASSSPGDYVRMYGGAGTGKWDIYGNGANLRIGDNESAGIVTIDTALNVGGNITRGGTVITDGSITDTGDFTIDAAGTIILDGDAAGATVHLKDGGVHWGSIFRSSSNFNIKSEASDTDIVFFGNDGGSTITALTLDMSEAGAATFNSTVNAPNFNTTSDVRLKDNIRTFESAMDVVSQLRGVRFAWKETGVETVGLIAQEVEKVLPELIGTNADTGLKSVSYSNMVAVLIEAVKELKAEIEELKKR